MVVDLPANRGCQILPWPRPTDQYVPDSRDRPMYFCGGTILLIVSAFDACLFVVDQIGRCGWVLALALRHLGAPPGDADTSSV